MHTPDTHPAQP